MIDRRKFRGTKLGGIVFLVIIGLTVWTCFIFWVLGIVDDVPSRIENKIYIIRDATIDLNSAFSPMWILEDVEINSSGKGAIPIVAVNEQIFLLGNNYALLELDGATGDMIGNYLRYASAASPRASSLAGDSQKLIISFNGTQKIGNETRWGAGRIEALAIDAKEVIWEEVIPGASSIDTMNLCGDTIGINGSFSSSDYLLNANTGDVLYRADKDTTSFIRFAIEGIKYGNSDNSSLVAYDANNEELWSAPLREPINQPIVCNNDTFLVRTYQSSHVGNVYAVDKAKGHILWSYTDILSNIDSNDKYAFFISTEQSLIAVDIKTGQKVDEITFSSEDNIDFMNSPAYLAVDEDMVFAYFDDSRQLFAFQFTPPPATP